MVVTCGVVLCRGDDKVCGAYGPPCSCRLANGLRGDVAKNALPWTQVADQASPKPASTPARVPLEVSVRVVKRGADSSASGR